MSKPSTDEDSGVAEPLFLPCQSNVCPAPEPWLLKLHQQPDPILDSLVTLAGQLGPALSAILTLTNGRQTWCQARYRWAGDTDPFFGSAITSLEPLWLDAPGLAQLEPGAAGKAGFYGGVPLLTPGRYPIGCLAVLASAAIALTPSQQQGLQTLAQQIVNHLELQFYRQEAAADRPEPPPGAPPCALALKPIGLDFHQQLCSLAGSASLDLCAVLESLDEGIVFCDRNQAITVINRAARQLLALNSSNISAEQLTEAVTVYKPSDRTPLAPDQFPLWQGLAGKAVRDLELTIKHPQGKQYRVSASSRPILAANHEIVGAVMSLYDITQRYQAETALKFSNRGLRTQARRRLEDLQATSRKLIEEAAQRQQAEASLRLFYDLPFLGMAIIAADAKTWLRFNDRLCEILGYPRAELQHLTWIDLTHPGDLGQALDQFDQLTARRLDAAILETRLIRKDGLIVYARIEIKVIAKADGSPNFFVTTIKDITERKLVAMALEASENRFRATFEQAAVGIAHVSLDGLLLWLNPALSEILGCAPQALVGQSCRDLIHPDDLAADQRYTHEALLGQRQSYVRQQRYLCQDGRQIWANVTVSLVRDAAQQPQYFVLVLQDITLAKQAETTLQQYAHRLRGLHEMDRAILTNFESQDIARSALLLLGQLLDCPQGLVARFDRETGVGEILADINSQSPSPAAGSPGFAPLVLPLSHFVLAEQAASVAVSRVSDSAQRQPSPPILQRFSPQVAGAYMAIPLVVGRDVMGEILLVSPHLGHFNLDHEEIAQEVADHLAIALQNARLFEQVKQDRARFYALSSQLLEAQETERRYLAHELHDEIGQALTAVKLSLRRLERLAAKSQGQAPLQDCLQIVDAALQQVRNLSLDLRPSMLDDLGLVPALRWYVNRHAERTGLRETLTCDSAPEGLPAPIETACFRIVQEALTNIARHAQAQTVTVTLEQVGQTLHLRVQDDGVGFDLDVISRARTEGTSLGILGMEERGMLIGGQLTLTSAPGRGTCITLRVPLAEDISPNSAPTPTRSPQS
jgi:PAS domain S-box-containing protein